MKALNSLLLLLAVLLSSACDMEASAPVIVGTVERDRIGLVAESNDPITAIHFREGDTVSAGDIVIEQESTLYASRLRQLQATAERAKARLAELVRGPRSEDISAARARLQGALSNLDVQRREYTRIDKLVADKLASPSLLDQALERREMAESRRDELLAQLEALTEGTTAEELQQAHAVVNEAEAALSAQQILLGRLNIRAPVPGILDALLYETGERPVPGSTIAVLLANTVPYARVYIPEPLRSKVRPGVTAHIHVDGINPEFKGTVRYVSDEATFTPYYALTHRDRSRLSYLAEIDFTDDQAREIPSGVPVDVTFPSIGHTPP